MRSYPMRAFSIANGVEAGVLVFFLFVFLVPALDDPAVVAFVLPFLAFIAAFVGIALAAWFWSRAQVSGRFWLIAAVPAVLLLLMFGSDIVYQLTHPGNLSMFIPSVVALGASIAVVASAFAARRDARLQAGKSAVPSGATARLVSVAGVALIAGAVLTAVLASVGAAATGSVPESTGSATIAVMGTHWTQSTIEVAAGTSTAIVVTNHDAIAHAFDIDTLNVHATLAPNSTSLVAVAPPTAGTWQFYCSVPGHRETMTGTLTAH